MKRDGSLQEYPSGDPDLIHINAINDYDTTRHDTPNTNTGTYRLLHRTAYSWLLLFTSFLLTLLPISPAHAEVFTLQQAIDYALTKSPALKAVALQIDQSDMDIKAAQGRFLPTLSTTYTYNRIFSEYATGTTDEDYIDQENRAAGLRLTQHLFTGFETLNRLKRTKLVKAYNQKQLALQKLRLTYQIQKTYFELLKKRYDVTALTQSIERLSSDLAAAKAFSKQQLAPYVHILQAEADLEAARQNLWKTRTAIHSKKSRLMQLMGLPMEISTTDRHRFTDEFYSLPPLSPPPLSRCIHLAMKHRPELEMLALQGRMARKDAALSRSYYFPHITLEGGLYDTHKSYDQPTAYWEDQHNTYWSAGISVSMSLFDGGAAYHENKKFRLEVARTEIQAQQYKLEISEAVSVAYKTLLEAENQIMSAEKALSASQENYLRQKKRLQARIGTTSEVLEAQTKLARAESGKGQALLDFYLALAELSYAMGHRDPWQLFRETENSATGQIKPKLDQSSHPHAPSRASSGQ